jgi:hypothetical protein
VIACNLNAIKGGERQRYTDLMTRLRAAIRQREDHADGCAYKLDSGRVSLVEVAEWMAMERLCCPFLTLQLSVSGDREDWLLTLTGPPGAKVILDATFSPPS